MTVMSTPVAPLPSSFGGTPSFPVRKRQRINPTPRSKRHTKNLICIPPCNSSNNSCIAIPRADTRSKLVEDGMVVKMTF